MRRVHERAPSQLNDMRRRFAKEFAEGFISKKEFDDVDISINKLENHITTLKDRHAKEVVSQ